MKSNSQPYRGFTLIELLTVIAIIALLAAILFPVFSRARAQARETSCISNLHEIYVSLKLYREDNGKFPAVLLGYAQSDQLDPVTNKPVFYTGANGNPIAIDRLTYRPLTTNQRYLKDKGAFLCPDSNYNTSVAVTPALYPAGTPLAGSPVLFQDFIKENCCDGSIPVGSPAYFYFYDSYDTGPSVDELGNVVSPTPELHYSLDWTGGSGANDPANQLKYPDPPQDRTVITWCTFHAAVAHSNKAMVLLLNGKAAPVPLKSFLPKGPLNYAP